MASRVFSLAQTAAYPEDESSQPVNEPTLPGLEDVGQAMGAGFLRRDLAEVVVLLDGRETRMRVGRSDHAEFVGADAERLLELEPIFQRRARVFVFQHVVCLGDGQIEIALVPELVVGELVVRRKERVRLAGALDLRHLEERLPSRPRFGIGAVDRLAIDGLYDGEHQPIREIAVVRDREDIPSGFALVGLHPLPEATRIGRAESVGSWSAARPGVPRRRRCGRSRCGGGCRRDLTTIHSQ